MEGPFTKSRKITLNSHIYEHKGERLSVDLNGTSENNESYGLKVEVSKIGKSSGEMTFLLNRDGVELWKLTVVKDELSLQISLQLSFNGTVYKADGTLERIGDEPKFLLKLTNDFKFLEFGFNKHAQSGNFNFKSNFIAEVIEALFRN